MFFMSEPLAESNERIVEIFFSEIFAEQIKNARKARFKSQKAFCDALKERTGCAISRGIWQRIETGEQELTVSQLVAASYVLFGCLPVVSDGTCNLISQCCPIEYTKEDELFKESAQMQAINDLQEALDTFKARVQGFRGN